MSEQEKREGASQGSEDGLEAFCHPLGKEQLCRRARDETNFRPSVTPPAGSREEKSWAALFSRVPHIKRSALEKEISHVLGRRIRMVLSTGSGVELKGSEYRKPRETPAIPPAWQSPSPDQEEKWERTTVSAIK